MTIKTYDLDDKLEEPCELCGIEEDLTYDDRGRILCTDCLFEEECKEADEEAFWERWHEE